MSTDIAAIRRDYKLQSLMEGDVKANPIDQFTIWWNEAVGSSIDEVNAMTLATCTKDGFPSARIVLLKGYTLEGFMFYTNYSSHKGREMEENPNVALVFFWKELERQVRIQGLVEKISESESDAYYQTRPEASKIGAWASNQSELIETRDLLEKNFLQYAEKFKETAIPRPPHWGGYLVKPQTIEFWQGRRSRLHDRIRYNKTDNNWTIERLAP